MLIIPPPKFRKGRPATRRPAKALNLLSAAYDAGESFVLLTFDRPINIHDIDVGSITVRDGSSNLKSYVGGGTPMLDGPATLHLGLQELNPIPPGEVTLSASNETLIVAVNDGGTWEGATNLVLPFP